MKLMKLQEPSYTKIWSCTGWTWKSWRYCPCSSKESTEPYMGICWEIFWRAVPLYYGLWCFLFTGIWFLYLFSSGNAVDGLLLSAFRRIFPWTIRMHRWRPSLHSSYGNRCSQSYGWTSTYFPEKYGKKYEVIDAKELGIDAIDESVNEYSANGILCNVSSIS